MKSLLPIVVIVAFALSACAPMKAKETLGLDHSENVPEQLVESLLMVAPKPIGEADVYAVSIPQERRKEIVCRSFPTIDGTLVQICRRSSRIEINGRRDTAFVDENQWKVFVPIGTNIHSLKVFSADGTESTLIPPDAMRKLSKREVYEVYERLTQVFFKKSEPIDDTGISVLYGKDTLNALRVPSLTTLKERMAYCGVGSGTTTEIFGVVTMNPYLALSSKIPALICSVTKKPNIVQAATPRATKELQPKTKSEDVLAGATP